MFIFRWLKKIIVSTGLWIAFLYVLGVMLVILFGGHSWAYMSHWLFYLGLAAALCLGLWWFVARRRKKRSR